MHNDDEQKYLSDPAVLASTNLEVERFAVEKIESILLKFSHDIRSPLGAIMGFNDFLKAKDLTADDIDQFTSVIERNAHQILRLLDDSLIQFKSDKSKNIEKSIAGDLFTDIVSKPQMQSPHQNSSNLAVAPKIWPSVLVIEDDLDTRELVSFVASDLGCEVTSAASANDALAFLASGLIPDLVLLDLTLPEITGAELLARFRLDERWKNLRVIILSGWDNLAQKAQEMGADGSLKKPFDVDSIESLIRGHAL